jgi:hypothetical protein
VTASFSVYGEDADIDYTFDEPRFQTPNFEEALAEFLKIVRDEEHGLIVWHSS